MKLLVCIFMAVHLLAGGSVFASEFKQRSMYTDIKAHQVGDLITVLIVEDSRATNKAKTTTKKKTSASTDGTAGVGSLDFIPLWGASGSDELQFDGQGQTEKIGTLRAKITVTVIAIRENGDLVVEGSRVIGINNEQETIFLSGIIRPRDVSNNNTIYSYMVGNAQISSKSKGTITNGHRPGFITKLINWIF